MTAAGSASVVIVTSTSSTIWPRHREKAVCGVVALPGSCARGRESPGMLALPHLISLSLCLWKDRYENKLLCMCSSLAGTRSCAAGGVFAKDCRDEHPLMALPPPPYHAQVPIFGVDCCLTFLSELWLVADFLGVRLAALPPTPFLLFRF